MKKIEEKMEKWADLYVTASSLKELMDDMKDAMTGAMNKMQEEMTKTIEDLPKGSKQVTKTT